MKKKEIKNVSKKNIKLIVILLLTILIISLGVTFAIVYYSIDTKVKTAKAEIDYIGASSLDYEAALVPISDSKIPTIYNQILNDEEYDDSVIVTEFSVQGTLSNTSGYVYDIILDKIGTNCVMLSSEIKWNLYKNGSSTPISTGTLSPTEFDGEILNRKLTLTNETQQLKSTSQSKDEYVFILWLSESCEEDILSCTKEQDQSKYLNHGISGTIKVRAIKGSTYSNTRTPATTNTCSGRLGKIDESGANSPDLYEGMIPVYYSYLDKKWKRADETNSEEHYAWYDYDDQLWANAVLVTEENREKYKSPDYIGKEIPMEDILAMYVWIPRYKYKLWNSTHKAKTISNYSYDAYNNGIKLKFENETETTGSVVCEQDELAYETCYTNNSKETVCDDTGNCNNSWYTHPSFTLGDTELRGIWFGKFELTSMTNSSSAITNITTKVKIVPGQFSWRSNTTARFFKVIKNMEDDSTYGLNSSVVDSHMAKNMDWGAASYLTHSKYGTCRTGNCSVVLKNAAFVKGGSGWTTTGCGPKDETSTSSYTVEVNTECNYYNTKLGQMASTTGNVSGIYDMNGGQWDYVMAFMLFDSSGDYAKYPDNTSSGFCTAGYSASTCSSSSIPFPDEKYYNKYPYLDTATYNNSLLGDALTELKTGTGNNTSWQSSNIYLPYNKTSASELKPRIVRGAYTSQANSIFQSVPGVWGSGFMWLGTRAVLTSKGGN